MSNGTTPPGFPIPVIQEQYQNWSRGITVPNVWTCSPTTPQEVVAVCNWAAGANFTVRPRGIMHGWSPLTVTNGEPTANMILVDLTTSLNNVLQFTPASNGEPAQIRVQTGMVMEDLMKALQKQAGGSTIGPGTGYSFAHIPAPGHLTLGGVLAINAHGTAIPNQGSANLDISYGSLSNQIVAFTAVVTDPSSGSNAYVAKSFQRTDTDALTFLTHLGRAFLLDVTLQLTNNYNLRCQSIMDIDSSVLFARQTGSTPPPQSCGDFLAQSGRIEIIWFPAFPTISWKTYPWLKVWTVSPQQPSGSKLVTGPYNYPFSDNLPPGVTDAVELMVGLAPALTPYFTAITALFTAFALNPLGALTKDASGSLTAGSQTAASDVTSGATAGAGAAAPFAVAEQQDPGITAAITQLTTAVPSLSSYFLQLAAYAWNPFDLTDLWGASMNTLLYVKDTTLLVTANGYAVQMKSGDVQNAIADFTQQFTTMLASYQSQNLYPINSPMEIRVTALDEFPAGQTTLSPIISGLSYDETAQQNGWDVAVWFDVLTVQPAGDPQQANRFYAELEEWIGQHFGTGYRVNPEWSKGWAYTAATGPWTNSAYLEKIRENFTTGRTAANNWAYEVATLAKYDASSLFWNPFLETLFVNP
jgi:FAD/FMN-containing dehydrogenase